MGTLNIKRTFASVVFGLVTAGVAMASDTIKSDASDQKVVLAHTSVSPNATAAVESRTARLPWAQAFSLQGPDDTMSRLVHVPGSGWTHLATATTDTDARPQSMSPGISTPMQDALSVFIDGPTGYTFVWIEGSGWKFVGRMTEARVEQ